MRRWLRFGFVGLGVAMLVVGLLAPAPESVGAQGKPACPTSWPAAPDSGTGAGDGVGSIEYQDFFTDSDGGRWFVIRSSDSNGYTTVRAYPAGDGGGGYVAGSPDEVCYLVVRRPGDTADVVEPRQVVFPKEKEKEEAAPIDPQAALIERLRKNAEEFEYSIGRRGGSLTYTTIGNPLTFNPALANDSASTGPLGYLFEGLTETSWLNDRIEPGLAERWEHSADGLTWTFHLRRGAQWHDGQPFTAHDVAFTFNRIIYNDDIATSARATFTFQVLDETDGEWRRERMTVTVVDDHTVRFQLPVSFAPFLRYMGTDIYPKHILEPHVDAGTFGTVWDIDTDPTEVVGTGPFTIASYQPGERLDLRRNPNYWLRDGAGNRLPYLDEINRIIVPDLAAQLSRFRAGETDYHGVRGDEFAALEPRQGSENFTIHRRGPGFGTTFLAFNVNPGQNSGTGAHYVAAEKREWFGNKEFRQAVAHVVNKDAIVNELQDGLAYPQWSSVSPAAGDFHNPNVRRYEYDVARANAILDGLGWVDTDGDGVREDKAGNAIEFTLVTNENNSLRAAAGGIIEQGMEAVGLKVDYRLLEWGDLVTRLSRSYEWEAVIIGFTGGPDPHGNFGLWHSSGGFHLWHPNQTRPATEWEAEIDELYVKASQELDHAKRVEHYHRAQAIVAENVPLIYTTLPERLTATRDVFGNTTATLYGLWDSRYLYRTD